MLDEYYGIVMMFDALSKELYSLKQGSGENVANFGVCLSQQVWILQSEYLGGIQQKHVEEMKQDGFYKGLNPKCQWMLAHEVDEHPAGYCDLLLAAQRLERWAETRDPLLPKTITTGGTNITCSQTSRNLFPSCKLKGSHTFTAQWATVECNEAAEDSGTKAEEEEGLSLQLERTQKPWVELEEQTSQLGILSILPMQLSCIRGKIEIVLDVLVLTILWNVVWRILARPPEKWV